MTDAGRLAKALARTLAEAGLVDERWRAAFEDIPRHLFVPRYFRDDASVVDGADPAQREQWLTGVYRDDSLITQLAPVPGTDQHWPTSSSTRPSLMAVMLGLLQVADDLRVLEIGTGTGYNAALLCHRLGEQNVTSVDIDPNLVEAARHRLTSLAFRPRLSSGDGAHGVARHAPYDRIIATCAVSAIPPAWITQLNPGGTIVADLRGELASALVTLVKTAPGTVTGRFTDVAGQFMWMRATVDNPLRDVEGWPTTIDRRDAVRTTTTLDPAGLDEPDLRFLVQLAVPDIDSWTTSRDGLALVCLQRGDGSWAEVHPRPIGDHFAVVQGGRGRVWHDVEAAAATWARLGRPSRSRLGLTARTNGDHEVWLDDPRTVVL